MATVTTAVRAKRLGAERRAVSLHRWISQPPPSLPHCRHFSILSSSCHTKYSYDDDSNQHFLRRGTLFAAGVASATIAYYSASSRTSSSSSSQCEAPSSSMKHGAPFPFPPPHNREVPGPRNIPSRHAQLANLQSSSRSSPYDVLVIGGGATGAGIAFDAATRTSPDGDENQKQKQLSVALLERGDFSSETSSRSTKLLWAGIKYLASASAALLSLNLLTSPVTTLESFYSEFKMVFHCHQERKYMLETQRHLTNWIPIVCPFTEWHIWPPPFGHWLFSFFPVLAPLVFKFYDGLSGFSCPSSYVLGSKRAREVFPQLNEKDIKYCAVFYEGQHNDARTNLAIVMSAAEEGAHVANYVEVTECISDGETGKVVGVKALDRISGKEFEVYAKKVIFAGGPFTDGLRELELTAAPTGSSISGKDDNNNINTELQKAVHGASGSHIVLPGYYAPNHMGLLDYNTSDGRFLFFLPWQGSVIVGTTDKKCEAETLPYPPEDEIQWMLKECEKYLSHNLKVRRSDVLSAWRGWRPLAADPNAPPGGQVSRDHVISTNPDTGVTFIAGGKWTTWREMAQDVLDKVLSENNEYATEDHDNSKGKSEASPIPKCNTLHLSLHGGKGWSESLPVQVIQKYGIEQTVAEHLVRTYGGRVWEVVELCRPTGKRWPRHGILLSQHFPYIEAEVRFACREYACTIEDILSRRTRLAFLNRDAAEEVIPRVADIMAEELGWSRKTKAEQIRAAREYLASYGGRIPHEDDLEVRLLTHEDAMDVFRDIDTDGSGFLDQQEIKDMATRLGRPLSEEQLKSLFDTMDKDRNGRIDVEEFIDWYNDGAETIFKGGLQRKMTVGGEKWLTTRKKGGGGSFLG